ncbi:hypothetical protein TUBRATIS_003780 [Tubulinosema ratisbonensis]|uniref:Uncharacterized protein n=1 Tax=Tubulinosema ratisbonensis TaxID=291195 RepID=A0A437AQ08_9MICR|nr:hypothetical protein TUBRATIS_003780 [Tubulinosema ratisbonensis]
MNLTKYVIAFVVFVAVAVFSVAGWSIRNGNNSIASDLMHPHPQNGHMIIPIQPRNKPVQRRSVRNVESFNTEYHNEIAHLNHSLEHLKLLTDSKKWSIIDSKKLHNIDPSSENYRKFLKQFTHEISEFEKSRKYRFDKVKPILQKCYSKLTESTEKMIDKTIKLLQFISEQKNLFSQLQKFEQEKLKKIFLNHPEYDVKYTNEYLKLFSELVDKLGEFHILLNEFVKSLDEMLDNLKNFYEVFYFDYEFDLENINMKLVGDNFKQSRVKEKLMQIRNFNASELVQVFEASDRFFGYSYSRNLVSRDFVRSRKEIDEILRDVLRKIMADVSWIQNKLTPRNSKLIRFWTKMGFI